ncbi:MAG TPA: DNA polymerase IV [Clostridiaceae bacterium]|nr:DNA polymerase IV [Clostridiaceae bacterium]
MDKTEKTRKRIIFLVDMNAFFISCETSRNPELKGKAAAVAGDPKYRSGIILAANYEARKFGVKTTMLIHEAKRLCPGIILVPPDHKFYNKKSREVMEILSKYSPVIQQNSIDEAWIDLTGCTSLFGKPVEIAKKIMNDIYDNLGLWCSIGISENKFLAKMASEFRKPMGITEIWAEDVKEKIWPLPIRQMYGIGKKTEEKLNSMGIYTIGDIANTNRNLLVKAFGKYGDELYRLANGIDPSPVSELPQRCSKSISRSTTLPRDIVDIESAKIVLLKLAEEVGAEARRYGYKGRTVSITIKYGDFHTITRQKSIQPTYLTKDIYKTAAEILEENWNTRCPVRLLGIGISNFDEGYVEQLPLLDFVKETGEHDRKKEENLEKAIDKIRSKFGTDKIKRALIIEDEKFTE